MVELMSLGMVVNANRPRWKRQHYLGLNILRHEVDLSLMGGLGWIAGTGAKIAKCRSILAVSDVDEGYKLT